MCASAYVCFISETVLISVNKPNVIERTSKGDYHDSSPTHEGSTSNVPYNMVKRVSFIKQYKWRKNRM